MDLNVEDIDDEFEKDLNDDDLFDEDDYDHWLHHQIEIKATLLAVQPEPVHEETNTWRQFNEGSDHLNKLSSLIIEDIRETDHFIGKYDELFPRGRNDLSEHTHGPNSPTNITKYLSLSEEDRTAVAPTNTKFGAEYLSLSEEDRTAVCTSLKGLLSAVVAMFQGEDEMEISEVIDSESVLRRKELDEKLVVQQEAANRMVERRKELDRMSENKQASQGATVQQTREKLIIEAEQRQKSLEITLNGRKKRAKDMEAAYKAERLAAMREAEELAEKNDRARVERERAVKLFVQQVLAVEKLQLVSKHWLFKVSLNKRVARTLQAKKLTIAATTIQGCVRARRFRMLKQAAEEERHRLKIAKEKEQEKHRALEEERRTKEAVTAKAERKKMEIEERKSKVLEVQRQTEMAEKKKRYEIESLRRQLVAQEKLKKAKEIIARESSRQSEEIIGMRKEEAEMKQALKEAAQKRRYHEAQQKQKSSLERWNQGEKKRLDQWGRLKGDQTEALATHLSARRSTLGGRGRLNFVQDQKEQEEERNNHVVLNSLDCEFLLFGDVDGSILSQKSNIQQQQQSKTATIDLSASPSQAPCPNDDPRAALRQQLAEAEERRRVLILETLTTFVAPDEDNNAFTVWRGPSRLDRALSSSLEVMTHVTVLSAPHPALNRIPPPSDASQVVETDCAAVMDVVGYMGLGDLKRVVKLELDVEGIERGLSALSVMSSLTSLSLSVNKLSNLKESGLFSLSVDSRAKKVNVNDVKSSNVLPLRYLCLRDNRIHTLEGLGDAFAGDDDGLRELSLDMNLLEQIKPEHLGALSPSLRSLSASANQIHTWPDGLQLLKLNSLDLSHNKIAYLPTSSLEGFPSLTHLDLARNELTVASGRALSAAKCLTSLTLSQNKLKEPPFPLRLPLLRKLWLGSNRVSSLIMWSSSLRVSSRPSFDQLSGDEESASEATWLPSLEFLSLENNLIRHLSPGSFVGLPSLQSLDLGLNQLSSSSSLSQFHCLEGLWTPHYAATNLVVLKLNENPVAASLPEPFVQATQPIPPTTLEGTDDNPISTEGEDAVVTAQAAPHVVPVPDWECPLLSLLSAKLLSLKMVDGRLVGPLRKLLSVATDELMNGRGVALVRYFHCLDSWFNGLRPDQSINEDLEGMNEEELAMMLDEYGVGSRISARRNKRRRTETPNALLTPQNLQTSQTSTNESLPQMWATRRWKCAACGGSVQPLNGHVEVHGIDQRSCAQCCSRHLIPPLPSMALLNYVKTWNLDLAECCGCGVRCNGHCRYFSIQRALQEASTQLAILHQKHHQKVEDTSSCLEDVPPWLDRPQATDWSACRNKHREGLELQSLLCQSLQVHCLVDDIGWVLHVEDQEHRKQKLKQQEQEIAQKMRKLKTAKNLIVLFCQRVHRGARVRQWWRGGGEEHLQIQQGLRRQACLQIQTVWRGWRVRRQMASALASAAWVDPELEALLSGGGLGDMATFLEQLHGNSDDVNSPKRYSWTQNIPLPQKGSTSSHHSLGGFEAYDELGPSVSQQQSRLTSAASSESSEVSLHSAHWGHGPDQQNSAKPVISSVRSSPIATTRSPTLPAISPSTLTANRRDETRKVMDEWGLSNPHVATNVLERQEHIKRAEKEAAQREKEADPVYRYHRLMRKVAQNNLDPDTRGTGRNANMKKTGANPSGGGKGSGIHGGWGMRSSVAQDRARNMKKKKKHSLTPAAWMPPIDQKS